MLVEKV